MAAFGSGGPARRARARPRRRAQAPQTPPLSVHQQVLGVRPVVDVLMAEGRLALGDLVLVVGEDVVHAARVEIDTRAQVLGRHGGALDVPAGESVAPGAGPDELPSRLPRPPQREVPRA